MPLRNENLSIVIVNWNSRDMLGACLKSIQRHAGDLRPEIIVIDNASFDGAKEMVKEDFPDVRFRQSHSNLGFAKANNLGARGSKRELLLFLNPDTEILPGALQGMLEALESHQAGMVGIRLINSDHSLQETCIQRIPSILNQLIDCRLLEKRFAESILASPCPVVPAISGACMMIRRELFEAIGGFSTEYFMYAEDIDLCQRVRQEGEEVRVVSELAILHHGGRSSDFQPDHFSSVALKESLFRFFRVHRGNIYAQLYRVSIAVAAPIRILALFLLAPFVSRTRRAASIGKWCKVWRWSLKPQISMKALLESESKA